VIGQKVNMAARLMMKFLNCITCDEVTKIKSALSDDQFKLAPSTKLKGISNSERIYEFSIQQ
jgi:class 3 adenylate cyclase